MFKKGWYQPFLAYKLQIALATDDFIFLLMSQFTMSNGVTSHSVSASLKAMSFVRSSLYVIALINSTRLSLSQTTSISASIVALVLSLSLWKAVLNDDNICFSLLL